MLKAAVIGYGSIGERHARWLKELGCDVAVVSSRAIDHPKRFAGLPDCLKQHQPEYVVIANDTSRHQESLRALAQNKFRGKVLIEKPLFKNFEKENISEGMQYFTAYNLRFHPLLQRIRQLIQGKKIIQVQANVGKYLPTWRPGQKIRYSGSKEQGGGVLRDLSHEIDYLVWLFGHWDSVSAIGGRYSSLEITSEDAFSILSSSAQCPMISLQMNYLDRIGRREILVQCDDLTIHGDLLHGKLIHNETIENFMIEKNDTYLAEHRAVLSNDHSILCSFREGLEVMKIIEAVEKAADTKSRVAL